jgi:hypothetical protein
MSTVYTLKQIFDCYLIQRESFKLSINKFDLTLCLLEECDFP